MTNPNSTRTSWEQAILNKATSNGERLALLERDVSELKTDVAVLKSDVSEIKGDLIGIKKTINQIESILGWLKWIGGAVITIALSLVANFFYSFIS